MPILERKALQWRYLLVNPLLAGKYARRVAVLCFVVTLFVYVVQPVGNRFATTDNIADVLTLQLTKEQISKLVDRTNLKSIMSSVVETKRSDTSIFDSEDSYEDVDEEDSKTPQSRDPFHGDPTLQKDPVQSGIPTLLEDPVQAGHPKVQSGNPKRQRHRWPVILPPSNAEYLRQLDYSKYTPMERDFLLSRIPVYEDRARTAAAACASRPDVIQELKKNINLVWDTKHQPNIVWCPNYKVASTTMMINFLRLGHFNEDNPDILNLPEDQREKARFSPKYGAKHPKVFDLFPTPKSEEAKYQVFTNALRVILVRHPFTRILSAYRDKMTRLVPKPKHFHFRDIQLMIIKKYRSKESNETSQHPTFSEFAQYVIDTTKNMRSMKDWRKVNCWPPFWVQCSSCNSDHNVIMKLETMKEDERFLITISDLKELKELKQSEWRHLSNISSHEAAPDYYRQLTQRQITDLYNCYKLDFQIYGYDIQDYLAIAKDA